jgi:hypothetical protein
VIPDRIRSIDHCGAHFEPGRRAANARAYLARRHFSEDSDLDGISIVPNLAKYESR